MLQAVIAAIGKETGLKLAAEQREYVRENGGADTLIRIDGVTEELRAEVRQHLQREHAGALMAQLTVTGDKKQKILVADYVNPRLAAKLRQENIQFMDEAGNAYLNQPGVFVYIKGNKRRQDDGEMKPTPKGRAFQHAGMRVVYQFLCEPDLVDTPYREIAKRAQVALGAVGPILANLTEQGYVRQGIKNKARTLADFDRLLDKWVEEYPIKLLPKITLGTFTPTDKDAWEAFDPLICGALWGGEYAQQRHGDYLRPKEALLYIPKDGMKELVTQARLRRTNPMQDDEMKIHLHAIFWDQALTAGDDVTGWILTYADLLATGEARNVETAQQMRAPKL